MSVAVRPSLKRSGRRSFVAPEPVINMLGVALTSPTRTVFPEAAVTKAALAEHYVRCMDKLLVHVAGRPLKLVRCPSGRAARSHVQTDPNGLPEHLARDIGEDTRAIVVETARDILELIQHGTLEIHARPVRVDKLNKPDRIVFDLDPGDDVSFGAVRSAAVFVREALHERKLTPFVLATGGRGMHIIVPIERRISTEEAREWSLAMSARLAVLAPRRFTTNAAKASRRGRICLRSPSDDATLASVAPYSSRVRPGAPLAVPLAWEDVAMLDQAPAVPVGDVTAMNDPWASMRAVRQRIGHAQWQGL